MLGVPEAPAAATLLAELGREEEPALNRRALPESAQARCRRQADAPAARLRARSASDPYPYRDEGGNPHLIIAGLCGPLAVHSG